MVGNDVVDLRDADASDAMRPRFDARVFCDEELQALDAAPDRALARWTRWAAKEAAYKAAKRVDAEVVFSPARFRTDLEVSADGEALGRVETPVGALPVVVRACEGAVHAVVGCAEEEAICDVTRLPEAELDANDARAPSRAVRLLATQRVAARLGVDAQCVEVRRRGRIPELWIDGERRAELSLSLSHHGAVVGFACGLGAAGGESR